MASVINFSRPRSYNSSTGAVIPDSMLDEAFRGQYDASNNLIYKGFSRPGSGEGELVWQIAFLTYDGNGNVLSILWPRQPDATGSFTGSASNDYKFSWTNRATYTYV